MMNVKKWIYGSACGLLFSLPGAAKDNESIKKSNEQHYHSLLPQPGELPPTVPSAIDAVKEGFLIKHGIKYRVFRSDSGAIYLPTLERITAADIEKSLCLGNEGGTDREKVIMEANVNIKEDFKLYSAIIMNTIKTKCGGHVVQQPVGASATPALEIGLEKETKGPVKRTYKIYNRNLAPNIGFRSEF
jgi:hypothetical protein